MVGQTERRLSMMNVYQHQDSAEGTPPPPITIRRGSNNFVDGIKHFVKRKRQQKLEQRLAQARRGSGDSGQSIHSQSRFFFSNDTSDDDGIIVDSEDDELQIYRPRVFSAPERTLLAADFAILRKRSKIGEIEVVAAFDKHADPYRECLQTLTCYDLAPTHGTVIMIDSKVTLHQSLIALKETNKAVALIVDSETSMTISMLSHTDCLKGVMMAEADENIGDATLQSYLSDCSVKRTLITANVTQTLWDAARLFCANRVHRIPVMQNDENERYENDVLYLLSLKDIFREPVVKQLETHAPTPAYMKETLADSQVGTWSRMITLTDRDTLRHAIRLFLDNEISSVPVVDENGCAHAVLTKQAITAVLARKELNSYLDIMPMTVAETINFESELYTNPFCEATTTVVSAMEIIVDDDRYQCLFVIDSDRRPVAAVAVADIMEYILNKSPAL